MQAAPSPSLYEQLMAAAAYAAISAEEVRQWPANPFPKGIRPGSATDAVMSALNAAHPRWLEHCDLMRITQRSRGAIAWGLGYLESHGMVRSIPSARNPQYLRYQAIKP